MTKLFLISLFIGNLNVTAYQPIEEQTDASPCITASNRYVHIDGVAISRDLHVNYGGELEFGDMVFIKGVGFKVINDLMHSRHMKSIDILVENEAQEAEIWKRFKKRTTKVWRIRSDELQENK